MQYDLGNNVLIGRDNADILPVCGHEPDLWNFSVFTICWKNCFGVCFVEIILKLFVIA